MNPRPTPRPTAALVLAGLMLATTLVVVPAPVTEAYDNVVPRSPVPVVYLGTNAKFDLDDWNYGYLGTDDAFPMACKNLTSDVNNEPICRNNVPKGYSKTYINLRQQTVDPDARAGVGLVYRLAQRCVGQQPDPSYPMRFLAFYQRWANVSVSGAGSEANAEIWADPFDGRNGRNPEIPSESHVRTEVFATSSPGLHKIANIEVTPPDMEREFKALLYSHGHAIAVNTQPVVPGQPQPPPASARADVGMYLTEMHLQWPDFTPPGGSWWFSNTNPAPFTGAGDSYRWYRTPVTLTWDLEDNYACPKAVQYRESTTAPYQELPVDYFKNPVSVSRSNDGRYAAEWIWEDWNGNKYGPISSPFGIDRVAPTFSVSVDPSEPDGPDGWWTSAPDVTVTCTDETSGCWYGRWSANNGATWTTFDPAAGPIQGLPDGNYVLKCEVYDRANWKTSGCDIPLKIDGTAPTLSAECTPLPSGTEGACPNSATAWRNTGQSVRVACNDGAGTGCTSIAYTLDGVGPTTYSAPLPLTADGVHTLALSGTDLLGHEGSRSYTIAIDGTPPTTPNVYEIHTTNGYTNQLPWWRWSSTDALSGGVKYSWAIFRPGETPNFTPYFTDVSFGLAGSSWADGTYCIIVRAKDVAGNVAEAPQHCVVFDRVAPTVTIDRPLSRQVYVGDQWVNAIVEAPPTWTAAIAQGSLTFSSEAADARSPIDRFRSTLGGATWTPSGGSCVPAEGTCDELWKPAPPAWGTSDWSGVREYSMTASDMAGNGRNAKTTVDLVGVIAMAKGNTANTPQIEIHWPRYDGPGTFEYYFVRRCVNDVPDRNACSGAALVEDLNQTSVVTGAIKDVTFHYWVEAVARDSRGLQLESAMNLYPARWDSGLAGKAPPAPGEYLVIARA